MRRRLLYHVSASVNRASILAHGLDPRLMGAESGIAGSGRRELDGVFVCHDREEAHYFVEMGLGHLDAVDVWEIDDAGSVLQSNAGNYEYLPVAVPAERVRLVETFTAPERQEQAFDAETDALDRDLGAAISGGGPAFEALIERGVIRRVDPEPPPRPLPPELAGDLALVLRDLDRSGELARELTFALDPKPEPWDDEDEEDEGWGDWETVSIAHADGTSAGSFVTFAGPDAGERRASLASALQRWFVELTPSTARSIRPAPPTTRTPPSPRCATARRGGSARPTAGRWRRSAPISAEAAAGAPRRCRRGR